MLIEPTDFILCGMPSEVGVLTAGFPNNPVFGGTAKSNLGTLVPPNCKRIISMGLGGGLSPKIKIAGGATAQTVTDGTNVWSCDTRWIGELMGTVNAEREMLAPWVENFVICSWYSSGIMDEADTAPQRADLLAKTGAWGIDDETFSAAVFCKDHGLKLNVLRFCSDDASETLPLAARGQIMNANGSPNFDYLMKELVSEGILSDEQLLVVAADANSSLAALQQCVRAIMPV
jgi:adenosylhomocysteine nucleosidase